MQERVLGASFGGSSPQVVGFLTARSAVKLNVMTGVRNCDRTELLTRAAGEEEEGQ